MATAPDPIRNARRRAKEATDGGFDVLVVDGVEYPLDFEEMNARRELVVFKATGLTWAEIMDCLKAGQAPLAAFAALVWLARDIAGDTVGENGSERPIMFEDVLDDINLRSMFEIIDATATAKKKREALAKKGGRNPAKKAAARPPA